MNAFLDADQDKPIHVKSVLALGAFIAGVEIADVTLSGTCPDKPVAASHESTIQAYIVRIGIPVVAFFTNHRLQQRVRAKVSQNQGNRSGLTATRDQNARGTTSGQ